ncbi:hypothetical protein MADA3029_670034 [Vibrio nigripulchritudo MADA3029]|nr:hypothetical protein VIBNIMADA3020_610034 [Vibrio nigripulchritudo MADA3020]CCN54062.1 hypothetical protein VIBNIMADA3021_500034 [Vibrio nigripulchritudo MADA3021]CCN60924.1 hypothetical protein MADA3029_670034 [Vibrio nigripulchritudo MADA3029]
MGVCLESKVMNTSYIFDLWVREPGKVAIGLGVLSSLKGMLAIW